MCKSDTTPSAEATDEFPLKPKGGELSSSVLTAGGAEQLCLTVGGVKQLCSNCGWG